LGGGVESEEEARRTMENFGISEEASDFRIRAEETNDLEKEEQINPVRVYEVDEVLNSPPETSAKYFLERLSDVSSSIVEARSSPALSGSSSRNINSHPCDGSSFCSDITVESKPHNSNSGKWEVLKEIIGRDKELAPRHFSVVRAIGEANLGDVYLTRLADTSSYFAMKVMNRNHLESPNKLKCLYNELEILQMLDHPFLPTLYHYFEVDNLSALVMEYCPGGDLFSLRQKKLANRFSERDTRFDSLLLIRFSVLVREGFGISSPILQTVASQVLHIKAVRFIILIRDFMYVKV
jgi:hypothetical protein